jgi:hypothetical protein
MHPLTAHFRAQKLGYQRLLAERAHYAAPVALPPPPPPVSRMDLLAGRYRRDPSSVSGSELADLNGMLATWMRENGLPGEPETAKDLRARTAEAERVLRAAAAKAQPPDPDKLFEKYRAQALRDGATPNAALLSAHEKCERKLHEHALTVHGLSDTTPREEAPNPDRLVAKYLEQFKAEGHDHNAALAMACQKADRKLREAAGF